MKAWEKDLGWFRLDDPPERRPLEEFIQTYLDTGDEKYLIAFLHYFEPMINIRIMSYVQRYSMQGHFPDMKSAYVFGILRALKSYDRKRGKPFMRYKEYTVLQEIHEYVRTMRPGFTVSSEYEYRNLRMIMRLYNESGRDNSEANLQRIADKVKVSLDLTKKILNAGQRNENLTDYYSLFNEDTDGVADLRNDILSQSAEDFYFYVDLIDQAWKAFDDLSPRQQNVVASRCGFCEFCHGIQKELEYKDIATNNGLSSAQAAENIYKQSVRMMRDSFY